MELRGHLDLMVLATLRRTGPVHGYGLIVALRDASEGAFDLPEGTVYPALHRLERDGSVRSEWDHAGPRKRRMYTLTPIGEESLVTRTTQWTEFTRGMRAILAPRAVTP